MYPTKLILTFTLIIACSFQSIHAQSVTADSTMSMYRVNRYVSAGIGIVGVTTNYLGLNRLLNTKEPTSEDIILALDKDDVNNFDSYALNRDLDKVDNARIISDIGLYTSFFIPAALFIDPEIRKEWADISLMYLETQAIAANIYSWSPLGPTFITRYRPYTYYDELPMDLRRKGSKRNSFFSGHVSTTATGAFFTAKVYCDFHPELGAKKYLVYALALIPTSIVAVNRIRSLNHFPTDTMMGTFVGAASGILIPQLHKNKKRNLGMSFIYSKDVKLAVMNLRF